MKNQKMMMTIPVLALALTPVACGTVSPTSPDDASMIAAAPSTVTAAAKPKPVRQVPGPSCTAQSLVLARSLSNPYRISAKFVDSYGKAASGDGCGSIGWSVSPSGAYVQPLGTGTAEGQVVDLVVTGAIQTYTVTATASSLTASIDVAPNGTTSEPAGRVGSKGRPNGPSTRICLATSITLTADRSNPLRLIARVSDSFGQPVSMSGCTLSWSASPQGAYVQPLQAGTADSQMADLVVMGAQGSYTVTAATTTGLTASILVSVKSAGLPY
jgi:hypothetical protein